MGLSDAGRRGGPGFVHPPMGGAETPPAESSQFAWDLPDGWKEIAPTSMRAGNFVVPGKDRLECYLTVLPGGGGGLAANLNRWRKQMGLADLSDAEIVALPRQKILGTEAPLLVAEGTFSGAEGFTMAAVALERGGAAVFMKMTGPTEAVRAEMDRFKALCASLREAAPAAQAQRTADPESGGFAWTAPEGWTQGPAKQMRLVTMNPTDAPGVECYVTVLGGAAGGVEANVNRWRQQMRLAPLAADAVAALPTVKVLGKESPMVEIDGGSVGVTGLVCELGQQTVFVKMTGPMEALRAQRERFVAFCKSLSRP
jgi:hypothetical protein